MHCSSRQAHSRAIVLDVAPAVLVLYCIGRRLSLHCLFLFHAAHVVAVHELRKRLGWDLSSAISFESASSPSKMHVTLTREHLNVDMRL